LAWVTHYKGVDQPDDRALIGRFLATREEAAFLELYRRETPRLYRIAARLAMGTAVRPDDVIQEAWLRGVTRLPGFRFESSLATWLTAIVVNVIREMNRPRADVIPFESVAEIADRSEADPAVLAEQDLAPILEQLPDGYRAVLILHDLEGFTHTEIAAALGVATGTAKSQLSRARTAARALLGPSRAASERRHP
jgi:RNA polymerase sigma-70 factor (ECF subfamily)